MFPFASILTEIPLIILAAAYMIYFGACALNKSHGNQNEVISLEIKEQIACNKSVIPSDNTFYYDNYSYPDKDISSVNSGEDRFYKLFNNSSIHIRDKIVITQLLTFYLFSRPPPEI